MRNLLPRVSLALSLLVGLAAQPSRVSADPPAPAAPPKPALTGRWIVTADFHGTPLYFQLHLTQQGDALSGDLGGDKLEGTVRGNVVQFLAKDDEGGSEEAKATVTGGTLTGTMVFVDGADPKRRTPRAFTAALVPPRSTRPPQRHTFAPTVFYREFSARNKPVLHVAPGDTIATTTVDAGGTDAKGVTRVLGGNPQTGPFYVDGAVPGDTLVVHLVRVRLNRDWAISDDGIVGRGVDRGLAIRMKDTFKSVRWHLDVAKGVATTEKPGEHLASYTVPLRPMLGCIGVAPAPAQAAPPTGDSGSWGGNMDFNEVVEGATVYLPVRTPGALLYVGDGHAAQGDGELNGNALETSMDVELTVDVISAKSIPGVRLESTTHLMAMGLDGSLDEAFRAATANMAAWLADEYKLTPSEIGQVLGTAAEYRVSEVADRNAGVVLKLGKERLRTLTPAK
ncbi:MAG: acetamidase [Deltaproteobacteria bacterium]|nr:MAG: acetamidase [Deltaproteobacteria bacterium]